MENMDHTKSPCAPLAPEYVKYGHDIETWHPNLFHVTITVQGIPVGEGESINGHFLRLNDAFTLRTSVLPQGSSYSLRLSSGSDEKPMLASCFVNNDCPIRIANSSPIFNSIDSAMCTEEIFPTQTFAVLIRLFTPSEWDRVERGVERPMQQLMFDHIRPRPLTELERRNLAMLHGKQCGHKGDITFMLHGGWLCFYCVFRFR